jgi:hypothetical protein
MAMATPKSTSNTVITINKTDGCAEEHEMNTVTPPTQEQVNMYAVQAEIEKQSELVALDSTNGKWTLSKGHGYDNHWTKATSNKQISDKNDYQRFGKHRLWQKLPDKSTIG